MRLPFTPASLVASVLRWRFSAVARDQASPFEAQARAYQRIRAALRGTEIERLTGLEGCPDLRTFAAAVPARDYTFFQDLVDRMVDGGEPRLLFRGPPVFVGLSSGTTGAGNKRLLHDRASIKAFNDYELSVSTIVARHTDFSPLANNRLSWGAAAPVTRTPRGVEQGFISGFMAAHPRFGVRDRTFPSAAVSQIADMKTKIQEAARQLQGRPIHLASAVPSYLLNLLEELRVAWGVEDFSRIWPGLGVVMYGGTPIDPYRAQITKLLGHPVQFLGMYVSTEGPLGYEIPSLNGGVNGLFSFFFNDIVFTFRKLDGDGRVLTVADLSAGDEVELLLTAPNGLVNYRIGDCLKIRSVRPLLFEITGRLGHGLNVATEKVTLSELSRAASKAASASPTAMRHFFVCPGTSEGGRPCYEWTLLFDRPDTVDRAAMIAALDRALMAENDVYRENREEMSFLDAPRLNVLDASVARRYFERDAHRGQLKMKTAFDSREKLREFLGGLGVDLGRGMSALSVALLGLVLGFVISIPPGPAGVIILQRSLRDDKRRAAAALAAFLAAELLVVGLGLGFLGRLSWLAALPWMKPAAGVYLIVFAVMAWRAAGHERGFAETSTLAVFRITILNPAIWISAVSILTIARASGGAGFLPRILFVVGVELGSLAWYLTVILGARHMPGALRRHLVRAAVLVIGATGAWFVGSIL